MTDTKTVRLTVWLIRSSLGLYQTLLKELKTISEIR
jgi:hypothetical protein